MCFLCLLKKFHISVTNYWTWWRISLKNVTFCLNLSRFAADRVHQSHNCAADFNNKKKFCSRLKRRRHCLRICVINSAALARQCGDNLMSSAISVIPRYHLNLERTEMDVRRRPIDQPPPPAVINAVAAIFEVKGFAWAQPVTTRAGLPQRRDYDWDKLKARCVRFSSI